MGRPSLADERRPQLLDAVIACIVRRGVAGTTVAAVAEQAGVQPSLVRHYVGNRPAFVAAAVERALAGVHEAVVRPIADLPLAVRLPAQLDLLFGGPLGAPEINALVDQLVAHSYVDEHTRGALRALYHRFQELLLETLRAVHPDAPTERHRRAATAVLALAHAGATFDWLAFDPAVADDNRAAAQALVTALLDPASPTS